MADPQGLPELAYVIGSYPLLTTTFIDREIERMRARGVEATVFSLRRPHGPLSPEQSRLDVVYARPVSPWRLMSAHLRFLAARPRVYLRTAWDLVAAPHPRLTSRFKTLAHFALAVHVADLVDRRGATHVHAHFVDRAAVVGLVVGRLLGIPYSATAHANDIYVEPVLLDVKLTEAKFVATCTRANADHLGRVAPGRGRVLCLHHGLDVDEYGPAHGSSNGRPLLLAVGQLKAKKGFGYLIEACRLLAAEGRDFRCEIIGEGPLRSQLEEAITASGLGEVVHLRGALPHEAVKQAYSRADLFVLPCVTAEDGDKDGIPNVILEAMASSLPVVSTDHSGIPEAVENGTSGILVPPGDPEALAGAVATLLDAPDLRRSYGEAGRKLAAESFDVGRNVDSLISELLR
ncbi:MAG: glycosyltransferase [Actinomycetota bacterium]